MGHFFHKIEGILLNKSFFFVSGVLIKLDVHIKLLLSWINQITSHCYTLTNKQIFEKKLLILQKKLRGL